MGQTKKHNKDECRGAIAANEAVLHLIASGTPVEMIRMILEGNNKALKKCL